MTKPYEIVIYGAGAVGASVGGWLFPHYSQLYFLSRGEHANAMKTNGLTLIQQDKDEKSDNQAINVIQKLSERPNAELVILTVKNFHLEKSAKDISEVLGDPIIVALQNGVENQKILPKYFSKIIYGIVCFNAVLEKPGLVRYNQKGPIILGTPGDAPNTLLEDVSAIFNLGFETEVTTHFQDAMHCKIITNLLNSISTLIGLNVKEISSYKKLTKIVSNLMAEGIEVIRAAGYEEQKLGDLPKWRTVKLAKILPSFLSTLIFKRKAKKYLMSSMSQDLLFWHRNQHELESLNGYILKLANKHEISVPYNQAIYDICKKEFAKPDFQPLSIDVVWDKIQTYLK